MTRSVQDADSPRARIPGSHIKATRISKANIRRKLRASSTYLRQQKTVRLSALPIGAAPDPGVSSHRCRRIEPPWTPKSKTSCTCISSRGETDVYR